MALGIKVGLGPGHSVLDGNPALPPQKGDRSPPIFGPLILSSNGWMDQDATWYGGNLVPGDVVLDGVPALPPKRSIAASFGPISIVATVAHLSYC